MLSAITCGPSLIDVARRLGWKVAGGLEDRYLFHEAAGDNYVSRCVTGLPVTDDNFAILPPHFTNIDDEVSVVH